MIEMCKGKKAVKKEKTGNASSEYFSVINDTYIVRRIPLGIYMKAYI